MNERQFHPAAEQAIEIHARRVFDSAGRENEAKSRERGFSPDFFAQLSLTEEDIVGPVTLREGSKLDGSASLAIADQQVVLRFRGSSLGDFESLVDRLLKVAWIGSAVSSQWIAERLLHWMLREEKHSPETSSFTAFLVSEMSEVVREEHIWVPIAGLSVESGFEIGGLSLAPLSKERLDAWRSQFLETVPPESLDAAKQKFNQIRKRTQGFCAVEVPVEAERGLALELAREAADRAIGMLRAFLPASASPVQSIVCRPLGQEYQPSYEMFVEREGQLVARHSAILGDQPGWVSLSIRRLEGLFKFGLTEASLMLASKAPSEFQSVLMRSLAIYSRVSISNSTLDKLVFLLASLETLLLDSQTEPIQSSVGDRLAFFLSRVPEERRKIVELTRSSYGVRSRYLHHGAESIPQEVLEEFFKYCWVFYSRVTRMNERWETRRDFIEELTQIKYS